MEKSLERGGLIMVCSSVIAKAIGVFYRIPLFALLSVEDVGIYQLVFPLYAFILALISGGLPVAVTRKASEFLSRNDSENAEKTTDTALVFFGVLALFVSALLFVFSSYVSEFLGNNRAKYGVMAISLSVFFACIIAVLRGYFQACKKHARVGFSLFCEQIIKCVGIVALVFDKSVGVVGAIIGVTVAEFITALILFLSYVKGKSFRFCFRGLPTKSFVFYSACVSVGLIAMPLNSFVDGFAVVNLLSRSFSDSRATALYGIMSGAVAPLIAAPLVVTSSFTACLLPALCRCEKEKRSALFNRRSKFIILLSGFFFCAYFVFAPLVVKILYPTLNSEDYSICVNLLKTASPIVLLSSLLALITTYLQSVDKPFLPAVILLFSVGVKALILPVCVQTASIYGAQIGNVTVYAVAFLLCCAFAVREGFAFSLRSFTSLFVAFSLFVVLVSIIYSLLPNILGCALAFVIGASLSLTFAREKGFIEWDLTGFSTRKTKICTLNSNKP